MITEAVQLPIHFSLNNLFSIDFYVTSLDPVGCIYAPYKVNPNIFRFYFNFLDIFHHTSMHPLFHNIYEFCLIFYDFISLSILILFGARFANTFPCIVPGVEIKTVYEIIVSHAPEQGICALNRTIPASPPQCLTVTEGVSLLLFSIIILLIKCR